MLVAEVLLRIGCTVIAWLIMYTHCLWLSIIPAVGCQSDGDALWRLLLGFAPVTLLFGFLLNTSRKVGSVHENLRWGVAPLILLIPLSVKAIWPTLMESTVGGLAICGENTAWWHYWWAPIQLLVLAFIATMAWRAWRPN